MGRWEADANQPATPSCEVSDANSWIPGWFTGQGAGLLYDMHNNPKPQYEALREVLRDAAGPTPDSCSGGVTSPGQTRGTSLWTCSSCRVRIGETH